MAESKPQQYRVLFVRDIDKHSQRDPGLILVAPSKNSWNNFGFRILVDFLIYPREYGDREMEAYTHGFLGFAAPSLRHGDARELHQAFEDSGEGALPADKLPLFFTMLPNVNAYRELVARLGPREAMAALYALHDMVAADERPMSADFLRASKESEVFQRAFLRTSESYFAWKNAAPILLGEEFEEIGRLSESLRINFQLAGRPNAHDLNFQFKLHEPVLPKRFAVMIGKNGVGKSQALGRIAQSALRGSGDLTDGAGRRPAINRLLAFYPTTTASAAFPTERRRGARVWYRRFPLGGPGFGRKRQTTSDLIVQLVRSPERIRARGRFEIFLAAIPAIDGFEEIALVLRDHKREFVRVVDLLDGGEEEMIKLYAAVDQREEPVRLHGSHGYPLSSGELAFLRFTSLASLYIENSSLLLFDEPETHLHPNFISQFVMLLDNLLEQTGSAAIISTHSAYFVREAFEEQVRVLRSGPDREIVIEVPRLKTFGADVGAISYFVFGEDEPSRLARQVEKKITGAADSWDQAFETYKDDLSLELLGDIREEIEDRDAGDAKR
ncbi:MAG: AAA family ATPase [Sphingopyxis sp.]